MKSCVKMLSAVLLSVAVMLQPFGVCFADGGNEAGSIEDLLYLDIPTVVTASMSEQTIDKVPGTVTVITENQIKLMGLKDLRDALNILPGFMMKQAYYGVVEPTVRGYANSTAHVKVMVDGYPINNTYDHSIDAFVYYPLNNVKQIEVIRGPGSSLYGTDAFEAVVNIITKNTKSAEVTLTGGEFSNKGVNAIYRSDPAKNLSYSIAADYFDEIGGKLLYQSDYLTGYNNDYSGSSVSNTSFCPTEKNKGKRRFGVEASLKYKALSLVASHSDNRAGWTESYGNILSPADDEVVSKYDYLTAKYLFSISDKTSVELKAWYDLNSNRYAGQFFSPGFASGFLPGALGGNGLVPVIPAGGYFFYWDAASGKYYLDTNGDGTAEYWPNGSSFDAFILGEKYGMEAIYRTQIDKHSITVGAMSSKETVKEVSITADMNPNYLYKTPLMTVKGDSADNWLRGEGAKENISAAYMQDVYDMSDMLSIVAGVRYDNYELAGDAVSPRIAAIFNAFKNHVIKFSYGKAFFAPNVSHRYLNSFGYLGDPKLKPQTIQTYEVSLQNTATKKLQYGAVVFYSTIDNQILFNANAGAGMPAQSNSAKGEDSKGVELEGKWVFTDRLSLWGNYSYVKKYDNLTNTDSWGYPENLGNAGFTLGIAKDFSFSASAHVEGKKVMPAPKTDINSFTTVQSALIYTGIKDAEISLTARNLLDEKYYTDNPVISKIGQATNFPYEGRQVLLSFNYKF